MNLRARWVGPPPKVGDYLMSEIRPRYAYRVERVTMAYPDVGWDRTARAEERLLNIVADRVAATAVPERAKIHSWKWDKREARGSRGRRA